MDSRAPFNINKGLVIASPWISLILDGQKDWEMRGKPTEHRGWFALIWKGLGAIYGVGRLTEVLMPLDEAQMIANFERHRIPEEKIRSGEVASWTTPWVLSDVIRLPRPVPYRHPSGAVTWVRLEDQVSRTIEDQLSSTMSPISGPAREPKVRLSPTVLSPAAPQFIGETTVTQGNIDNNHFYLRNFIERFPDEIIGGANKSQLARRTATVHWVGGDPVITDIDGSKKFFRSRGWIGSFFRLTKAVPGDKVSIEEIAPFQYRVFLRKAEV